MSFRTLFQTTLDPSEEQIVAALFLLGRDATMEFFSERLSARIQEGFTRLTELPEPWAKQLALNVLQEADSDVL